MVGVLLLVGTIGSLCSMSPDFIIGNFPFGKIGVDIVNKITKEIPYNDISILGTTAMLSKHNDVFALEYVYIADYTLNPVTKCKWVSQLIILGYKGQCDAVPIKCINHPKETLPNEIRIPFSFRFSGHVHGSLGSILTRNRDTSIILPLSDEDYEYIKKHWDEMDYVERFWWLVDRGFYKKYVVQSDNQ